MTPIRYATSLFTFYIKGEIKDEHNFVVLKKPNTILGIIPLGAKTDKIPINQIASTSTNFKLQFKQFLIGLILIFASFAMMKDSPGGGFFVLLIGFCVFIDAFEIDLVVTNTAGQENIIDFLLFEKKKAELASNEINEIVSGRLDDTNMRAQTDRINDNARQQTDRIVDAISRKDE